MSKLTAEVKEEKQWYGHKGYRELTENEKRKICWV